MQDHSGASRIIYIFIFMCIFLYLISILFVHVYNVVHDLANIF